MAPRWANSPNPHKAESMFGITLPANNARDVAEVLLLLDYEKIPNIGLFDRKYVSYATCWDIIRDATQLSEDVGDYFKEDILILLILFVAAMNGEL